MKCKTIIGAALGVLLLLGLVGWSSYEEVSGLEHNSAVLLEGSSAKPFATIAVNNKVGRCLVSRGWVEQTFAWTRRKMFGMELPGARTPVALVFIAVDVPDGTTEGTYLELVELMPPPLLASGSASWTEIDGKRYWLVSVTTAFPPPATVKLSCDGSVVPMVVSPVQP